MDNGVVQILVTVLTVLGSAGIWKYMEARLKAKATMNEQDLAQNDTVQFRDDLKQRVLRLETLLEESNAQVITLTAKVGRLETEVLYLTKENERLKNVR
jgi:phage host-nuclease inhibitor protein Gam